MSLDHILSKIDRAKENAKAAPVDRQPHASDCATHNAPAMEPGPCDCKPVIFGVDPGRESGDVSVRGPDRNADGTLTFDGLTWELARRAARDRRAAVDKTIATKDPSKMIVDDLRDVPRDGRGLIDPVATACFDEAVRRVASGTGSASV